MIENWDLLITGEEFKTQSSKFSRNVFKQQRMEEQD